MIDELCFFTIPVDIRTGLQELGFTMSTTKLNIWIGQEGWHLWIRRWDSVNNLGTGKRFDTLVEKPSEERVITGVIIHSHVVEHLTGHLRNAGYPVDAILRRCRLLALIA